MSDKHTSRVVVIGLGRFGSSLAKELTARGCDVLGIDSDPRLVRRHADQLTHTVVADTTDADVLRRLDVHQFQRAVVGIGTDLQASILTTGLLVHFAVPNIWAKAISRRHGRILERIGAHHVVLPEHEMGKRVAHLVTGRKLDYIEFEDDYAMAKTQAPEEAVGRALGESRLRTKYGVTVVGVKRPGEGFTHATADTVVNQGDVLIVAGRIATIEQVANLP
ncbi:trk system potassium uptake protein TrkA [Actinokineospora alba]|uniref:Trk system potassium uptake protein TrkA n=1 Tax=Actinokineospora alba TaxID=504798 RepID=A0A1H0FQ55_9PSEU|nr:TrkA family potassium uptake protein [Actinokineospora alba]TDP69568.1 trk system potassium uptake protein TrkA [Actinokineospora alba]SDI13959.1 trk system potassium uptake protein TrkA [Actinokineospora alba]SDN96760.1 trk system potassium uptake protein TrkA [Actinokineospora alba]